MAVPPRLLWPRDPHTAAKHEVLRRYYNAWFPIMLRTFPSVTVFEGYAGPGEYEPEDGAVGPEGSPLVAMRSLLSRRELVDLRTPVRFVFLEDRHDRVENLRRLVAERLAPLPPHVTFVAEPGRCERDALAVLSRVGAWGHPIFANLDPFDAFVPLDVVRALGRNGASEAFVTFMSNRLIRFASVEHLPQGDEMFGEKQWRQVQHLATEAKEPFLVERYRGTLASCGLDKIVGFQLLDERGLGFWLLHATSHERGIQKMKDSMWNVDPIRGFHFRDPRRSERAQLGLPIQWEPDLRALRDLVVEYLDGRGRVPIIDVRRFALLETAYKEMHASKVLADLMRDGVVHREPKKGKLEEAVVWLVRADPEPLF